MSLLIPIHVAWRDERGAMDKLTHVEFTNDCEMFALGTDPLDGEDVSVYSNFFILDPLAKTKEGALRIDFRHREAMTGNCCWDTVWVSPAECAKLAEWLNKSPHWTVEVGATGLWDDWKEDTFDAKDWVRKLILEASYVEVPF